MSDVDKQLIYKVFTDPEVKKALENITNSSLCESYYALRHFIELLDTLLGTQYDIISIVKKIVFDSIPNLLDYIDTIPKGLFENVKGIRTIKLNSNIYSIERNAFGYCIDLKELDCGDTNIEELGPGTIYGVELKKLILPKTLTYISADNLVNSDLTEIEFRGTREQWHRDVGFSYTSDGFGRVELVKCSDGDIKIENYSSANLKFIDI